LLQFDFIIIYTFKSQNPWCIIQARRRMFFVFKCFSNDRFSSWRRKIRNHSTNKKAKRTARLLAKINFGYID